MTGAARLDVSIEALIAAAERLWRPVSCPCCPELARALRWTREQGITRMEATRKSMDWWAAENERAGKATVMYAEGKKAKAWFLGKNVPGKQEEFLVYMGGGHVYQALCRQAEEEAYASFLSGQAIPAR